MSRPDMSLEGGENATVILRRAGETRTNYLSHVDVEEMVARGWQCEIIHDGGDRAKAAIVADMKQRIQRRRNAN